MSDELQQIKRLGAKRRALREQLAKVNAELRPLAVAAVLGGEQKIDVAKAAGVTRPALDGWIEADANAK